MAEREQVRTSAEIRFALNIHFDPLIQESARQHLAAVDGILINQMMALAKDDLLFRSKLRRQPDEAALERGYFLSESGADALADMIETLEAGR